ncbi:MAG: hypothetical protein ACI4V7_05500 [Succinivibrionaceae bacterium]
MEKLTLKDVVSVIGADNVMTVKAHQRAMKQYRLEISQIKEVLDVARESIEAKLPNHIGKKEVREINEDIRTIQSAREKLVELKDKIRKSELVCKTIFLNAKEQLAKRQSRSNQTEVRKEIPTHSREDWQAFLRSKIAELKAKKAAEQKQYTEKTATKTQTNEPKIAQEPSDKDVKRVANDLLGLLNLIQTFDQPIRPRSSRDELEDLFRGLRWF